MKLNQFMQENTITGFDVVEGQLIISVNTDNSSTGLDVDTSAIVGGTPVKTVTDYSVDGDVLTVDGLTLNVAETNIFGGEDLTSQ